MKIQHFQFNKSTFKHNVCKIPAILFQPQWDKWCTDATKGQGMEYQQWSDKNSSTPVKMQQGLHIDGLVQERCNSSALAMELRLSCTNPSIYQLTEIDEYNEITNIHQDLLWRYKACLTQRLVKGGWINEVGIWMEHNSQPTLCLW